MKNNNFNKWFDYKHQIDNKIMTTDKLIAGFNIFKENILDKYAKNEAILIQLRILQEDQTYKSISPVEVYLSSHANKIKNFMVDWWTLKASNYKDIKISNILYTYKIPLLTNYNKKIFTNEMIEQKIKIEEENINEVITNKEHFSFGGYDLPNTMDITTWGKCVFTKDFKRVIIKKEHSSTLYEINIYENYYDVNYINYNGEVLFSFKDIMIYKNDLNSFKREINKHIYIFEENNLIFKEIKRQCEFIQKSNESYYIDNKFITLDIETMTKKISDFENKLIPYCISIYDGKKASSFYLTDYKNNSENMLNECLRSIMLRKYNGYKVYIHNFSRFDGVFLFKLIVSLFPKVDPIIKDDQIINIKAYYGPLNKNNKHSYKLLFRDSFLLLPSSLAKLAKNFDVENKGIFPYEFVNEKVSLDYKGEIPNIKYFSKINQEEYNNYINIYTKENKNLEWDLRNETIKYCELDCKVLYNIIKKFNKQIFDLFNLNVIDSPTLSSLALKLYKTKFLDNAKIPIIEGNIYKNIKKAYTGGAVDVYKPDFNIVNNSYNKGYYYDVNSLYPYVMLNNPMPIGNPIYFEGNILNSSILKTKNNERPFGIFEVEIETPKNLNIPILQLRYKKNGEGFKTISPLGKWTGWYFSEEIYNAMNYGYKFNVIKGYLFEKEYIFSNYVNNLYSMKLNSIKDTPNYIISKLLLNSLYGKLGMNPEQLKHIIIDSNNKDYYKYFINSHVSKFIDFKNGKELISYSPYDKQLDKDFNNKLNKSFDVSIAVAVAVTAYARIFMSKIKSMNNFTLYYSDTDSIIIDKPLIDNLVGPNLGQFKLEYVFDEGLFLCPKVYAIKWSDLNVSKEIIKIKGLKEGIKFNDMKHLLIKNNNLPIYQDKWYRSFSNGDINIKDEIYTLMLTENKRKLIFNNENIFINTEPFIIDGDKILNL